MNTQENIILTPVQYDELTSFITNTKNWITKTESLLSTFKANTQSIITPISEPVSEPVKKELNIEEIVQLNTQANIDYDNTNPVIHFEKQWWICNSYTDWKSNRDNLFSQFGLTNFTEFSTILESTKAVVAGGFAVNCLFGFDLSNYKGDIDIFMTENKWLKDPYTSLTKFTSYFTEVGYIITSDNNFKNNELSEHHSIPQECPKKQQNISRIVNAYKSLHKITRMITYTNTINGIQKVIQVIFTEYDCIRSHIRTFDMSICQTFFDYKYIYTRYKYHILTLNKVNMLLKKNVDIHEDIKYLKRVHKYKSRGFRTYFDINQIPFIVQDKKTPMLRNKGFNQLLEWKNNCDNECPVISLKELQSRKILYYVRIKPNAKLFVNDVCKIHYCEHIKADAIIFENKVNEFYLFQLVYLVDTEYNIIFVEESIKIHKNRLDRKHSLLLFNNLKDEEVKLVKDPVAYLVDIEVNIKKIDTLYSLTFCVDVLCFYLLKPLLLFVDTDRIGNPFKHKYTEIFNTYIDILQTKLILNIESNNKYSNIQSTIQSQFMTPIFEKIKDIRWLLSLMLVYPNLFVFNEKHYKFALELGTARDNLYIIKRELKDKK